jgi:hypothetical protein
MRLQVPEFEQTLQYLSCDTLPLMCCGCWALARDFLEAMMGQCFDSLNGGKHVSNSLWPMTYGRSRLWHGSIGAA